MNRPRTPLDLDRLRRGIRPLRLHWFPRLRSTNDHAMKLRREGSIFAPALVLTGRQIKGRGRGANAWWSGVGSITMTLVLPVRDELLPHQLPLLAGLALRDCLADFAANDDIHLKWPNDLVHSGRKLAGLLCERIDGVDLIGVGLNVNEDKATPFDLKSRIVSLEVLRGGVCDRTEVLIQSARALHRRLSRAGDQPFASVLRQYDRYHALRGRRVSILGVGLDPPLVGTCQGLDSMGRLLVKQRGRVRRVVAGQVRLA